MSQQQTVLRVLTNIPGQISGTTQYDFLDLYSDVPIKINKSISEIENIAKKNSDFSIGLTLPGSKKNNRFFENFFNVDAQSLYFNATQRVNCDVLLNDQSYFKGYLRLNKVSVLDSKVEYDITLYSTVGELFGLIGNNLLKDLDYTDSEYTFNHTFDLDLVTSGFTRTVFDLNQEKPTPYFYPIVHNGYEYSGSSVTLAGNVDVSTRLYTSTSPISGFTSTSGATDAGADLYHINSPLIISPFFGVGTGLVDNQLKPGLNIWNLFKLIFKTYGYTIKSDFFNTPWFKGLYMYGYFSSELTKFSYKITNIQQLPLEGVELIIDGDEVYVCKLGTGIPCYCSSEIIGYAQPTIGSPVRFVIPAGTYGVLLPPSTYTPYQDLTQVPFADISTLKYTPKPVGTTKIYVDGDYINFNLVITQDIKQIDILSSIAKKFDLVFVPDPDVPNQLIIEPYDYYIGTGEIYDWTPFLSYDKGFTVQPALNNIESNLILTDLEDNDEGNRIFKNQNNRIYGQNNVYNITDFKSQEKKIDTIFSPELIRKWDKDDVDNINVPLGINYAASNNEGGNTNNSAVIWQYKGVRTKPKLIYWLGPFNPFKETQGKNYINNDNYSTYNIYLQSSTGTTGSTNLTVSKSLPVISHTMPMGLTDDQKINNDSLCILFNSELPSNIGVETFNTYTNNDVYNSFYGRRIGNLYNPNTRFIDGYFDLKYSDVQNLKWNDLIKVNEQYFTINKIDGYNLTNRELTKVQLIQYNSTPQTYPTRYFSYDYCDGSGCYKFKTDFTNPNLRDTNFNWSVWYDHNSGVLGGLNNGFYSTFNYTVTGTTYYVPFFIKEISQTEYEGTFDGCSDWTCDTLRNNVYTGNTQPFNERITPFWVNSNSTKTGLNLFISCSEFTTIATDNSINVGSSTYFGTNICP